MECPILGGRVVGQERNTCRRTPNCCLEEQGFRRSCECGNRLGRDQGRARGSTPDCHSERPRCTMSFLQNTLSEVNFPAPGGGGEPGWVRPGRSLSRRRG